MNENYMGEDYIVVKAQENGVTLIGLTRGRDTKFHHTEKLDQGEVMILQFTEHSQSNGTGRFRRMEGKFLK